MKEKLLDLDATSLFKKIIEGEISSLDLVKVYINHIKLTDKEINAVVEERFEAALKEAEQADHYLKENKQAIGPLHGVPISIKESFDVKGMRTTGGLIHLKNHRAIKDAQVVKKLKDAGAIILCKTNTSTLCYAQESVNKLYGVTNNPWDLSRTAGGSSGGEGALLATGGSAIGIGSDIGGSIRFPSHFSGVIGFKSGMFQINAEGHFPADVLPLQKRMSSSGPIGKSVRDMRRFYNIIAESQVSEARLDNISIEMLPLDQPYPLSDKSLKMLNEVKEFLKESFTITEGLPPYFEDSAQLWQEMMSINGSEDVRQIAFNKEKKNVVFTYIKEKLTGKTDWHEFLLWAIIGSSLFKPTKKRIKEIEKIIQTGDDRLRKHFENKLLILPVYPTGALKHREVFKQIFSIRKTFKQYMPYTAYSNVWGLPTLTIPISEDEDHMPIALQIISINGNEDKIFALGKLLEKQFRGYQRKVDIVSQ